MTQTDQNLGGWESKSIYPALPSPQKPQWRPWPRFPLTPASAYWPKISLFPEALCYRPLALRKFSNKSLPTVLASLCHHAVDFINEDPGRKQGRALLLIAQIRPLFNRFPILSVLQIKLYFNDPPIHFHLTAMINWPSSKIPVDEKILVHRPVLLSRVVIT